MATRDAATVLLHDALLYEDHDAFVAGTVDFVESGLTAGEPVMVAVPGEKIPALRAALGVDADRVDFADMHDLGRNPARIIPALRGWLDQHDGQRTRFVGEPIWPGRTHDEVAEATWHEALLNVAFADSPTWILCPYDVSRLDSATLDAARCTHPAVISGDDRATSERYDDLGAAPVAAPDWPLTDPPADARTMPITMELRRVRALVEQEAVCVGLGPDRLADLLVAVNEAATNSLVHGAPPAWLCVWHDDRELVCEIRDGGRITDPLLGRERPDPVQEGGRGLWLIHQLCDLAQLRSGPDGTTLRLHMTRD